MARTSFVVLSEAGLLTFRLACFRGTSPCAGAERTEGRTAKRVRGRNIMLKIEVEGMVAAGVDLSLRVGLRGSCVDENGASAPRCAPLK